MNIELLNLCIFMLFAFQLITTTRSLVLCADSRREMEDWLSALKAASLREYYEPGLNDTQDFLANHHHWYNKFYHSHSIFEVFYKHISKLL